MVALDQSLDQAGSADCSSPPQPLQPQPQPRVRVERLERLAREHSKMVWRLAQRLGVDSAEAEDVVQKVLLIAAARLNDLVEGKERAFLVRTTLNITHRTMRSRRRHPENLTDDVSYLVAQEATVDELVEQQRKLALLDTVLHQLPKRLREVLVLFEIEGCSQPEISELLGIPQGTVASRLRRARKNFLRIAAQHKLVPKGTS